MKCLKCKKGTIVGNECQTCYSDFEAPCKCLKGSLSHDYEGGEENA